MTIRNNPRLFGRRPNKALREIGQRMALLTGWLLIPVALATPGFSQLAWQESRQAFTPGPLDKEVVAHYRFVNAGTSSVTVREVRTSCGCTTAALAKSWIFPKRLESNRDCCFGA